MSPSPLELFRLIRPASPERPRPLPPPQCVNGGSLHGPEHLPLEGSPSRALRWSPRSVVPNIGSNSQRPFAHSGIQPQCARPRPLTSATTEVRLSSQTPLTRFCNISTRNPSTPTNDVSSREEPLSYPSLLDPTEVDPSREQRDTGVFVLSKDTQAGAPKAPAAPAEIRGVGYAYCDAEAHSAISRTPRCR